MNSNLPNQNFRTSDPVLDEFSARPSNFISRKKKMVIAAVVVILVLVIIGGLAYLLLSRKSPPIAGQTALTEKCVSGTTLTWWAPDVPYLSTAVLMPIVEKYNQRNPQEKINVQVVNRKYDSYEYYNNIIASMAKDASPDAGASPDIFMIRNDDLPGYLDYVTPFASVDSTGVSKYKQAFVDIIGGQTVVGDQLYGIANYVDTMQLYYNKQILDQNKISKPAETWDDIVKQTAILTKEKSGGLSFDQSTIAMGTGNNSQGYSNIQFSQDIIPLLINQKGGVMYDEINNSVQFKFGGDASGKNSNAFLNAINFYQQFGDDTKRGATYNWDEYMENSLDAFAQNKLVYMLAYRENEQEIKNKRQGLDFQIAPIPQFDPNNKKASGKFFMSVINARLDPKVVSDNPKADAITLKSTRIKKACAEKLLIYMAGKEAQDMFFTATKMPPARRDIIDSQKNSNSTDSLFAGGSLMATTYYKPDVLAVEAMWNDMMFKIRSGVKVESAAQEASTKYSSLVSGQPKPRHESAVKPIIPGSVLNQGD